MITLFPGRACDISFRTTTPEGVAVLTDKNSAGAEADSKILLRTGRKSYYLTVSIIPNHDLRFRDTITTYGPVNSQSGRYQKISDNRYRLHKALGTSKAKWSLPATVLSVASAAGASIKAAQHSGCSGLGCVSGVAWFLIALSGASAIFAWGKDNLS